jgi:hypothetical protein
MEFKIIDGFNSRYAVGPDGTVYSMMKPYEGVQETPVTELKAHSNKGYMRVALRKAKWSDPVTGKYVHRLVAEAYLDNPNEYEEVNHINGDKTNNSVENLEWCSRQQNITHAWDTGLSTNSMNEGKGMTEYIGTCLKTGAVVSIESKELLKAAGFTPSCVIRVCNGERKSHKGMTWNKIKSSERT